MNEFEIPQTSFGSERTPQDVRKEIRHTRHKKEVPLYLLLCILGIAAACFMLYRTFRDEGILNEVQKILSETSGSEDLPNISNIAGIALIIIGLISGIGALIALVVIFLAALYRLYGEEIAYGVRVSEKNFPEIYNKVQEFSRLLGLKKPPTVYIRQQNGILNAFTSWVPGRTFIQLNAEIVDIAYLENKDFDTLFFVLGHEMGHIYLHHVQIYYNIWYVLSSFIPVIGPFVLIPMLSRAREYSADRVGQALTEGKNAEECMMLLGAGRHLYKHTDAHVYVEEIMGPYNFFERLGRWVINLMASHPIMPFRTKAMLDPEKKSGRLL